MNACVDFFFPPGCALCSRPIRAGILCRRCIRSIRPEPGNRCTVCHTSEMKEAGRCTRCALDGEASIHRFIGPYRGAMRTAIKRIKFGRVRALLSFFGDELAGILLPHAARWDFIVPVPIRFSSYYARGFHQTALLSERIAALLAIPVIHALRLRAGTRRQTGLRRGARLHNVEGAFRTVKAVTGSRILLIDDVVTTGATTGACARALLDAKAGQVDYGYIARSPSWHRFQK